MADNKILSTTQYKIKKLAIVSKIGTLDITGFFEELNIFDSIFNPCMTGNVLINDSIGLSNKLSFDGSEVLIVEMGKTDEEAIIRKSFRIYKQSDRKSLNLNSEAYLLHFVSDEFLLSQQIKISQSFKETYSKIVRNILSDYLGVTNEMIGYFELSDGIRNVLIPNKSPIDAINFCSRKALNADGSPTFLFFENKVGYNFVTLSTLLSRKPIHHINFQPKNLADDAGEMMGASHYEVVSQFDYNKNIYSGLYAGTFVGFDIATRSIATKLVNFDSIYRNGQHANKTPDIGVVKNKLGFTNLEMFNSRRVLYPTGVFGSSSSYIKNNDPYSIDVDDDTYNYVLQREASFRNLLNRRLKVVMPGNFDLTSGLTASLIIPNRSEKAKGIDEVDYSLSGKYLIIASRHILTYQKHETVIEVATDSSNRNKVYQSVEAQNDSVDNYG
jgi:hypothetical protein